jgi:hypothetical protein
MVRERWRGQAYAALQARILALPPSVRSTLGFPDRRLRAG